MEELKSEELEELVQELESESDAEESPGLEVEKPLRNLQAGSAGMRLEAAHQLGDLHASRPRIVEALITAQESDSNSTVRWYAANALRSPVHQRVLEQHPDLMERAQDLTMEAATVRRARQETEKRTEQKASQAAREASASSFLSLLSNVLRIDLRGEPGSPFRCALASSAAGIALGWVIASTGASFPYAMIAAVAAGACVGAVAGAEVRGGNVRIVGLILGATSAGTVALVVWGVALLVRIVELLGA